MRIATYAAESGSFNSRLREEATKELSKQLPAAVGFNSRLREEATSRTAGT